MPLHRWITHAAYFTAVVQVIFLGNLFWSAWRGKSRRRIPGMRKTPRGSRTEILVGVSLVDGPSFFVALATPLFCGTDCPWPSKPQISPASIAVLGGLALLGRPQHVMGANDRVRIALCGVRGRGMDHLRNYSKLTNVEIAAVCDIDDSVAAKCLATMERMGLAKPKTYVDIRKLLEDKNIDAISIATPNHWHALMAIWGCQAGKDVYVEKPCTHNLGRAAIGQGGESLQPHRPARHPDPLHPGDPRSHRENPSRLSGRRIHDARGLLQMARYHRARGRRTRSRRRGSA